MLLLIWYLGCILVTAVQALSPHIILIVADDLGWNDVSFHGSDQIPTPNIDALAYNGVILNNYYSQSTSTSSRAALLTGRYPFHLGMQGESIMAAEPRGLPLQDKILPEFLKDLHYVTKAVGKWHLGFYKKEFTPTYRGFDSHLGYWGGYISYYDHILQNVYPEGQILSGYDFRRNMDTAWELDGQYATDVFTDECVNIIRNHNSSSSLFLYVGHLAVHAGNVGKPLEAPQESIDNFRYIPDPNRRTLAAMVSKLDESVGQIIHALADTDMLNNSIIIFISDNGAPSENWGSNYPFRGIKQSLWEGGVRCIGLVWSPMINSSQRASNELMHVTDWLPTLFSAAGGNLSELAGNFDGVDQWNSISYNEASPRKQVLLNIDEVMKTAAIRDGDWKLVIGSFGTNGSLDRYYGESGRGLRNPVYNISSVTNSTTWTSTAPYRRTDSDTELNKLRESATVKCSFDSQYPETDCNPSITKEPCLFNIVSDPCEMHNLANIHEAVLRQLYHMLIIQKQSLVPQLIKQLDFNGANPAKFNYTWSPWED
ncbi:arylsulfatase B-like [Zootermopsis nevadensis]|uniref:Arylsulfatase B n=1 Tax=Zootermopsis nevadensis TaxID=136037 RepID=A0A067QUM9_ZOONE|nr:arylsulfatase B-like [Zootermopsis nevadensis]XP_021930570.1 arylsulfatase B-like [Zootermopsis nevadensis]KDR13867.1 Arylsulfatase B [Zootermopsis nevadensis]